MGFEPTTASLEGWNSTTELRPPSSLFIDALVTGPVSRELKTSNGSVAVSSLLKPIDRSRWLSFAHETIAAEEMKRDDEIVTPNYSKVLSRRPMSARFGVEHASLVGRQGFEPWKRNGNRFTVCPLCPLGYLPVHRHKFCSTFGICCHKEE